MKLITLLVTEPSLEALDALVLRGLYPSRAEAIRLAIHDLIELHGNHPHKSKPTRLGEQDPGRSRVPPDLTWTPGLDNWWIWKDPE